MNKVSKRESIFYLRTLLDLFKIIDYTKTADISIYNLSLNNIKKTYSCK